MTDDKADRLSANYKAASLIEAAVEYFIFYEMGNETSFPAQSDADSEIALIRDCFKRVAGGGNEDFNDMLARLADARKTIIEKMQVITAYADRFLVYEYVMNRIEARYTMKEQEIESLVGNIDKDRFTSDVTEYIFSSDEPAEVNERVREVIGQLPVRMSRTKFLDYIKDSIKLYSDSDRYSLDGYLYMIRTSAMLYEPEGMKKYFRDFDRTLNELAEADYVHMEEDYYNILSEKIGVSVTELQDISDLYMALQRMINGLYVYALHADTELNGDLRDVFDACVDIINAVERAFDEGYEPDSSPLFQRIEGVMEKLYEERTRLEAMLGNEIPEEASQYRPLKISERLMSSSIFAELEEDDMSEPVTSSYLEEVTEKLLEDMRAMIKQYSRPIVRAVYAVLLSSIPVFFRNSDELSEYIRHSIEQCGDKAELIACYSLIVDMMYDSET